MSFVLDLSDGYNWPVKFSIPVDGTHETQTFEGRFARLPQERVEELLKLGRDYAVAAQSGKPTTGVSDRDIAGEVLIGWDGITTGDAKEVPYSKAAKTKLLSVPGVAAAITSSWCQSLRDAREGN
jgi:hypothetical protein